MAREALIQILYGLEMDIGILNIGEFGYCTDTKKLYIGTASGNELLVAAQTVGDMLKSIYDTDNDGIVDAAESVPWSGVTGKPSTFTPSSHTHTKSQISDFPSSLPANGGNAATVNGKTVLENVPAGAKFTDTVYTHPASHPASIITQDSNNRFVTDGEKTIWSGKQDALGYIPVNKTGDAMTGSLTLPEGIAARAPLKIPHGAAPSAPENGDIWTTTSGVLARINGTTRTLAHTSQWSTVSQAEAETGTATSARLWTAQRVAQAIAAQATPKAPLTWGQLKGV